MARKGSLRAASSASRSTMADTTRGAVDARASGTRPRAPVPTTDTNTEVALGFSSCVGQERAVGQEGAVDQEGAGVQGADTTALRDWPREATRQSTSASLDEIASSASILDIAKNQDVGQEGAIHHQGSGVLCAAAPARRAGARSTPHFAPALRPPARLPAARAVRRAAHHGLVGQEGAHSLLRLRADAEADPTWSAVSTLSFTSLQRLRALPGGTGALATLQLGEAPSVMHRPQDQTITFAEGRQSGRRSTTRGGQEPRAAKGRAATGPARTQ